MKSFSKIANVNARHLDRRGDPQFWPIISAVRFIEFTAMGANAQSFCEKTVHGVRNAACRAGNVR